MTRLFGTDGVRGLANADLTPELALGLSVAAARVLVDPLVPDQPRPVAVVGRDTRLSGQMLEAAVVAGLTSAGVDVVLLGELPTPGVAHLTARLGADLGVMISASHNAMPDNGIKFFARGGLKLEDDVEDEIESETGADATSAPRPVGGGLGRVRTHPSPVEDYASHLVGTIEPSLAGLTVVLDCANGAASEVGPKALRDAGAEVITLAAEPDGLNINDGCGSTHIDLLRAAVVEHGADAGFAVDGDADRCLAVDAAGEVVDGDQILAILALALHERGALRSDTVVATVMSNLGFVRAMATAGVSVRQTAVGDRYVLEAMKASGHNLGGEQSGHVIMSDHATTGDGLLSALHVLARMAVTRSSLADLAGVVQRMPQVLVNVAGVDRTRVATDVDLADAVAKAEAELGETGRVLLRPSGTEQLVRVMVEAADVETAQQVAGELADVVRRRLAL
ncbi:phosphoglucosamine mutase [Marmoricola endophyticus]|uniref:Phosphoglucosamine mutase n=1 Tax=Marmoricola endophyticus TaxID=2040280 RepID=A0A917BGU0_9ACTN|nr:phosphoglucosamine mutase [Marmoricola endophyticus]GGF42546.1 phosphoglucosamine mutase [Marmoricola endophyticus]